MNAHELKSLLRDANLAPSVHNTQPTRWRLGDDGSVAVLEDTSRRLPVGDAAGRDAAVSHGAAIEGFALACAGRRLSVEKLEGAAAAGLRPVARLTVDDGGEADPLHALVPARRTYRGIFEKSGDAARLDALNADDALVVRSPEAIAHLAQLNDEAGLRTFRNKAYRAELVSWMRLSRNHPNWASDGLNAEAMEMSRFEALGASIVLRPGVFEVLDRLGVARTFVAEAPVVRSASAIVLFHRPQAEDTLVTGRRFYRLWLQFTGLGVSAAPMAVLADDEETRALISRQFGLAPDRRLITAFRIGPVRPRALEPKPRLPVETLIV
jgi:hypothetical protein